jgi:hypothetical protein
MSRQRTLGVQRDISETLQRANQRDPRRAEGRRSDENSRYHVGMDLWILLDEVVNNTIRAILIYDTFSGSFTDFEVQALSTVMKYNKSVIAINMNGVEIGDASISLLCDSLIHSNVQLMDFTNTPLDDDAGRSLLALCHLNHSIRTVVVDDTLISEDLLDDIDLACVYNEKTYPEPEVYPIEPDRRRYCVQHLFGVCPNGVFCPLSHEAIGSSHGESGDPRRRKRIVPEAQPLAGPSWQGNLADDDSNEEKFVIDKSLLLQPLKDQTQKEKKAKKAGERKKKQSTTEKKPKATDDSNRSNWEATAPYIVLGTATAVLAIGSVVLLIRTLQATK